MKGTVLVTGGAGFIGSHLVEELVRRGHRVRVLDDFSSGREENLAGVSGAVEILRGDCVEPELAARACRGVRWVFHEAAVPSVQLSVEDPRGTHRVNVEGTLSLLEAGRAAGVERFVLAGSSAVYGNAGEGPKREDDPVDPCSPYAAQKLAAEALVRAHGRSFGLRTVVLRYFNVYGPRQDPASPYSGVISLFSAALLEGRPPTIFGDGLQSRDFVFVEDVVRANLLAVGRDLPVGAVVNVAGGRRISVNELYDTLKRLAAERFDPSLSAVAARRGPSRPGEVRHSQADLGRAREWLGYEPGVPLEQGLAKTLDAYAKECKR